MCVNICIPPYAGQSLCCTRTFIQIVVFLLNSKEEKHEGLQINRNSSEKDMVNSGISNNTVVMVSFTDLKLPSPVQASAGSLAEKSANRYTRIKDKYF